MDNLTKNFFLIISSNYFEIQVVNEKNQILFKEKFILTNRILGENLNELQIFLDKHIFKLEKKFNIHIEDIFLIVDNNNFINIDVSLIKQFKDMPKNYNSLNDLSNIKENVLVRHDDYQLIHMIINKFVIDNVHYSVLPKYDNLKNIFLEVKFICLKKDVFKNYKNILQKYQISIKSILNYSYVNSFRLNENQNEYISIIAKKLLNGLNPNEIRFSKKHTKNYGFFEKFFKFFG